MKNINPNLVFSSKIYLKFENETNYIFKEFELSDILIKIYDTSDVAKYINNTSNSDLLLKENFMELFNTNSLYFLDLEKLKLGDNLNGKLKLSFEKNEFKLFENEDFFFFINFINIGFNMKNIKQKTNFVDKHFQENMIFTKIKGSIDIKLNKNIFKSYTEKFFGNNYQIFEEIKYKYKLNENFQSFFEINFDFDKETEIIERKFLNIRKLLSEYGGLLSSFKSFGFIIHFIYLHLYLKNLNDSFYETQEENIVNDEKQKIILKEFFNKNFQNIMRSFSVKKKEKFKQRLLEIENQNNLIENYNSINSINKKKSKNKSSEIIKDNIIDKNSTSNVFLNNDSILKCSNFKKKIFCEKLLQSIFCFYKNRVITSTNLRDIIKEILDVKRIFINNLKNIELINVLIQNKIEEREDKRIEDFLKNNQLSKIKFIKK